MKKILLLIISISPFLMGNESIPEKLLLSSKAFVDNPDLYPVYRIDLIIFSHKQLNDKDKQEMNKEIAELLKSNRKIINITPEDIIDIEEIDESKQLSPPLTPTKIKSDPDSTS